MSKITYYETEQRYSDKQSTCDNMNSFIVSLTRSLTEKKKKLEQSLSQDEGLGYCTSSLNDGFQKHLKFLLLV